jgi:hypothetical protein
MTRALIIVACAVLAGCDPVVQKLPDAPQGYAQDVCPDCGTLSRSLAYSLDHEPKSWQGDRFRICRFGIGPCIWIANEEGGLDAEHSEGDPKALTGDAFGPDRHLVYAAYQRWALKNAGGY